jgi:hypothetical protein
MNGANCHFSLAGSLEDKMGAHLPGRLEDHGLLIIGINAAVRQNARRADDENIHMKAASAAAQAEHDTADVRAAYFNPLRPQSLRDENGDQLYISA